MQYKHPGVYIEHVPSGALSIEAASLSTAVFVGPVPRGAIGEPVFLTGVAGYAAAFGDAAGGAIRDLGDSPDYFGHAVTAFFDNGGSKAYVVRVGTGGAPATAAIDPGDGVARGLYLSANSPGTWGNRLAARLEPIDATDLTLGYALQIGIPEMKGTVLQIAPLESFRPVFMDPANGRFVGAVVGRESALVKIEVKPFTGAGAGGRVTAIRSGSLRTLNLNDVKGKKLVLGLNGTSVDVDFFDPLNKITVTRGAVAKEKSGAMATLAALVALLNQAMLEHGEHAGFRAYLDEDQRLVLVPPAAAGATAAVTIATGAASTARAPLKLEPADRETLDHPGTGVVTFIGGTDTGAPAKQHYADAFTKLRDYRDVGIIVLPGLPWTTATKEIIQTAIAHAEFMQNAMVIFDPPDVKIETPKEVADHGFDESPYAALYHPWLEVTNPHYNPDTAANRPRTFALPPSATLAGLWARIDGSRGIWKAPAGLEASVRGTRGPKRLIGNDIQDNLNELGVNLIRSITGPPVVWGARTRSTRSKPEFRYISVRRTQNLIGESLYRALQAVVFEPNNDFLWASLRASVGAFMDGLWRAGAFQGVKASDAYYVRCGLGSTMTQGDIDGGIVRVVVGFAPLKPAEFVVVQVQQIVGQTG